MKLTLNEFREVWFVDFEYSQTPGDRPTVLCMVAKGLRSEKVQRQWMDQSLRSTTTKFEVDPNTLFVTYRSSDMMNCYLSMGWTFPQHILDLQVEFRNLTNGKRILFANDSLSGALFHFGLDGLPAVERTNVQETVVRGGPFTDAEKKALLDSCEKKVITLEKLFLKMSPMVDLPRALFRGEYMKTVAVMETTGIPVDIPLLDRLRERWSSIKNLLIQKIDNEFGVYEGTCFSSKRFQEYLHRKNIPWPKSQSGHLVLDDDTFRSMSKTYPVLSPLRELKHSLDLIRPFDFPVGADRRHRNDLRPFQSKTGRNQPSSTKFIFGTAVWTRGLIKPTYGFSLACIDWSQQEFGIAAALSQDSAMIDAYRSGDPYLMFAKQAGVVPMDATANSHPEKRERFKQCALAVLYGMDGNSLAEKLGMPSTVGQHLLQYHRRTYSRFWKWSESTVNHVLLGSSLRTVFGWTLNPHPNPNVRSLANFPVQANGAEMLRIACILGVERGIRICAPIHDAVLVEAPTGQIEAVATEMQDIMREASRIVLAGLELRTDVKITHFPNRYMDKRGVKMWNRVMELIDASDEMVDDPD